MFADVGTARVLRELRQAIARRGLSLREVDRRLGVAENSVSRLLRGKPRLRMDHVFEILRVLEMSAEEFWDSVYDIRRASDRELDEELLRLLERLAEIGKRKWEEEHPEEKARSGDNGDNEEGSEDDDS